MPTLFDKGPVWLDATRLLGRVGRPALTGVDRVELAYLDHVLKYGGSEARFLCRTTRGVLLLSPEGGAALWRMVRGEEDPGTADNWSRVTGRGGRMRHRAEATLRPFAVDRALARGVARLIQRQPRPPAVYLNTGHSNLSNATLGAFAAMGATVGVLIHDLIPLTYPETVAADMPGRFATRIETVRQHADLVICNSAATSSDLGAHWQARDRAPERVVAHLGIEPRKRPEVQKDQNAFVMLGTIEPRKGHDLMLDVWDAMADRMPPDALPRLHIIGARGWRVGALLDRLDKHALNGTAIFDHGPLSENDAVRHLASANALLFPSRAEGFGLPPLEALSVGTQPICGDLPVLREILDDQGVYLPVLDAYPWVETIMKRMSDTVHPVVAPSGTFPTWSDHFQKVGAALATFCRTKGP